MNIIIKPAMISYRKTRQAKSADAQSADNVDDPLFWDGNCEEPLVDQGHNSHQGKFLQSAKLGRG